MVFPELPEHRIHKLLIVFMGRQKHDFQICTKLVFVYSAFIKSALQHVYDKLVFWRHGFFSLQLPRSVPDQVAQEILKLLHESKRTAPGSENVRVLVQRGEVKEERLEDCLFDQCLQLFNANTGILEALCLQSANSAAQSRQSRSDLLQNRCPRSFLP